MAQVPSLQVMGARRRALVGLAIGLAAAAVLLAARGTRLFGHVELACEDLRTRHFVGSRAPDPRLVLAIITEDDLAELAEVGVAWPWTDDIRALLPRCLEAAGAQGLVMDEVFLDRARDLEEFEDLDVDRQLQIQGEQQAAGALADALRGFGPVVTGFQLAAEAQYEYPKRVAAAEPRVLTPAETPPPTFHEAREADLPVTIVAEGARYLGFVNVYEESDGIVRRAAPFARWGERPVGSLAVAGATVLSGAMPETTVDGVRIAGVEQRLDEDGAFLVNFVAPPGEGYMRQSAAQLLRWGSHVADGGTLPAAAREALAGKLVIWGMNALANEDVVAAPTAEVLEGPEFQATVIDNLLHGDGRVRVPRTTNALVLMLLCALFGLYTGVARSKVWPLAFLVLVLAAFTAATFVAFGHGRSFDLFTPLLGLLVTGLAGGSWRLFTEGRRNRWLEGTFGRYLAPDVIAALKQDPSRLELGGRRREISIFFSDVAGFTSISEKLQPEAVVRLLNRYLTGQSAEVMERGGVIDKFEGDAIMAFFGDPLEMADHAVRACRAAVACIRALPALEPVVAELGLEALRIRIGINTGTALVGNMGSERRFDYTCLGDAVNLASRLEGANKHFGSLVMIGPETYAQARKQILAKPLADLVVVGRSEAVRVYELVSTREDASADEVCHVEAYRRAHEAARQGDLEGARRALAEAAAARPGDGPTAWLEAVLGRMEGGEIASPWDGRVVLTAK